MSKPVLVLKFIVNDDGTTGILIDKPLEPPGPETIKKVAQGLFQLQGGKLIAATGGALQDWGKKSGNDMAVVSLLHEWRKLIVNDSTNGPLVSPRHVFSP